MESLHTVSEPSEIRIYCANRLVAVIYTRHELDIWVDERCDFIVKKLDKPLVHAPEG